MNLRQKTKDYVRTCAFASWKWEGEWGHRPRRVWHVTEVWREYIDINIMQNADCRRSEFSSSRRADDRGYRPWQGKHAKRAGFPLVSYYVAVLHHDKSDKSKHYLRPYPKSAWECGAHFNSKTNPCVIKQLSAASRPRRHVDCLVRNWRHVSLSSAHRFTPTVTGQARLR